MLEYQEHNGMLQWNLLMVKKAGTNVIFNVRTSLAARHNHIISGSVLADKVCNIYDLEGCRKEWTLEWGEEGTNGGYGPYVIRGGAVTSDYGDEKNQQVIEAFVVLRF